MINLKELMMKTFGGCSMLPVTKYCFKNQASGLVFRIVRMQQADEISTVSLVPESSYLVLQMHQCLTKHFTLMILHTYVLL